MFREHRNITILTIAAVLIASAFLIPGIVENDSSDGAEPSYVKGASIKIFDHDSTDYSELAYLSDELPSEFNAAEWVKDSATGMWYNVNSRSPFFGKVLRYGNVSGMTNAEIRSDIAALPACTTTNFVIIQIGCDVSGDCTVGLEIRHEGTTVKTDNSAASLVVGGCYVSSGVQHVNIYTVANSGGDIDLADKAGLYSVTLKCNGIVAGSASTDYKGTIYTLTGSVKDKGGKNISNATVSYEITDSEGIPMTTGSITTRVDGSYTLQSVKGTIVNITSVTADGFTFDVDTYSYGTITGDVYDAITFTSNENYIKVTVRDRDGRPAAGVEVKATWFTCTSIGGGYYSIDASEEGISVPFQSDTDGTAIVTIKKIINVPGSTTRLLIKGMTGSYTFEDVDDIYATPSTSVPLPDHLDGAGNVYADLVDFMDTAVYADDHSTIIHAAGNIDSSFVGGAPLNGVRLNAIWYYQYTDSGEYIIADREHIEANFDQLKAGKAWFASPYSAQDGTILLHYTIPTWNPSALSIEETAYLYVYASGAASSATSADYTFTYALPVSGSQKVDEFADNYDTCQAREIGSIGEMTVRSDEVAYRIVGEITGDVPESANIYCITPTGKMDFKLIKESGGVISFEFTVKAGMSCRIEIGDVVGYSFTNQKHTMPSAYSDLIYESVGSASPWVVDRDTPVSLKTYTISGGSDGDILTFRLTVAGTDMIMTKKIDSDPCTLQVNGWIGNVISSVTLNGENMYIRWIDDDNIAIAHMTQIDIVTYYNETENLPTIDNVIGGQSIQVLVENTPYSMILTDAVGKATVAVPNIPDITFKFGNFTVASTSVTEGAYAGCSGLNLKDVIDSPASKYITITLRHIATSSLNNETAPTNVDILDSPETLTLTVGEIRTFIAPDVNGFTFSGWFINGSKVSDAKDLHQCSVEVTSDLDGSTLVASYAAENPELPKEKNGTTIAIGILAVTIALIAMIYVILQIRRY